MRSDPSAGSSRPRSSRHSARRLRGRARPRRRLPAAPKSKTENAMAAARKALDEVGDMNYQARSLNDVIKDVKKKTKVPVILDSQVFQFGLDPNQPVVTVEPEAGQAPRRPEGGAGAATTSSSA